MRKFFAALTIGFMTILGVGLTAAPAAADTWACNYYVPPGEFCGKASNASNSRARIYITDHNGTSKVLEPGYWSRGSVYMRDVAKVTIPSRSPGGTPYCAEWRFAGVYRGLIRGGNAVYLEDNSEINTFKVRWC